MRIESLHDLFVNELRDLYHAENQLVKALPRMAKAVSSEELRRALEEHLEQTRGHVERLEQVFEKIGLKAKGKKCEAMEGIIAEGKELLGEDLEDAVLDAGIIGAAQKVEHYEMAGYGTVRAWAERLGLGEETELLQRTLDEEKAADEKLTQIAENIVNLEAVEAGQ